MLRNIDVKIRLCVAFSISSRQQKREKKTESNSFFLRKTESLIPQHYGCVISLCHIHMYEFKRMRIQSLEIHVTEWGSLPRPNY